MTSAGCPSQLTDTRTLWPSARSIAAQRTAVCRLPLRERAPAGVISAIFMLCLNGAMTPAYPDPDTLSRQLQSARERTWLLTHGEKSAAYMADGYARASGRPGVCMAQVIGALNLAAGLRDAWLAHSPVLAFTGGRDPSSKFRKVYQEVDDVPAFESVTKFNATVDDVARFPDMVRQAFRVATTGTPGPVHLQFRGNEGQVELDEAELEPSSKNNS